MSQKPKPFKLSTAVVKTVDGLASLLRENRGSITSIRSIKSDSYTVVLVRIDGLLPQKIEIRSVDDAKNCFDTLYGYFHEITEQSDPLEFEIAFANVVYKFDAMLLRPNGQHMLPSQPPEVWPGKRYTTETPLDFFERVWASYLDYGLDSAKLKNLDKKLWEVIRKDPNWPSKYKILSNYDKMANALEKMEMGGFDELTAAEKVSVSLKLLREEKNSQKHAAHRPAIRTLSRARNAAPSPKG